MAELVTILRALLGSDNNARSAAEAKYEQLKKENPQQVVALFMQMLPETQVEIAVREQAAVLLRQCLGKIRNDDSIWSRLGGEPAQREVLGKLLVLMEGEYEDKIRRKIADCVQSLGNQLIDLGDAERPQNAVAWPELMPTMMRVIMDVTKGPGLRSDALWVMKEMACTIWQILVASTGQTLQVIRSCWGDTTESVRATAACLFCETVGYIETKEERKAFSPLLQDFFGVLTQLASSNDPKNIKLVLQSVATTTEDASDFYKDCLASHVLPVLTQIAKSHGDDEVRRLALEVLVSLIEGKAKMVLKVPDGLRTILEVCVRFLMELNDDLEIWAAVEGDDEPVDGEEQHSFGAEVIDRLCGKMKAVECFPQAMAVLQPVIAELFQQSDWKPIVAGLVLLRQIMEYIDDEATVTQVMTAVKGQLIAPHPRVRGAAWGCVLQAAKDHSELVCGDEWSKQLLPLFLQGLDDPIPRNVLSCMGAFHHYGENVEREDLEAYVQPLMMSLGKKLQNSLAPVIQRETITTIAVIAGQIQDGFAQFYAPLMPVLKEIIGATIHKVEERMLLGKAFECISLLATAVGKDVFRSDAETIMGAMIKAAQMPDTPKDDPVKEYMMAAAERICSTLREDFLPFVPHLLPIVLSKLQLAPKEYDEHALPDDEADVNLAVIPGENGEAKILVMSSSELEEVGHAVECVHCFVEKLGTKYAPFVAQTAQALLPVFEFTMSEEIRNMAFETWAQLCHGAREAGQNDVLSGLVVEFMKRVLPKLEESCDDFGLDVMKTRADGITHCLKEAGPNILGEAQVQHICQLTQKLVNDSFNRRLKKQQKSKKPKAAPGEDSDEDGDDEEEDEEQLLRQAAFNCTTAVMTQHPDLFVKVGLPVHLPLVQQLIDPTRIPADRRLGLYGISSLNEHLGDRLVPHWPGFAERVLMDIVNEDADLRAPACYAISFLARQAAFAPQALKTAQQLAEVITRTRGLKGKKKSDHPAQMAADNALSALMELLVHHAPTIGDARLQFWNTWVSGLPCQQDESEGVRNHQVLLRMTERQMPEVVGPNGENIGKILAVLVDIYKTEMVDDVTNWSIGKLLVAVGDAKLQQVAGSFSEKQKKKVARVVRDAQKGVIGVIG